MTCDIYGKPTDTDSVFCQTCRDEMDNESAESQKLFDVDYEMELMTGKPVRRNL